MSGGSSAGQNSKILSAAIFCLAQAATPYTSRPAVSSALATLRVGAIIGNP